MKNNEISFDNRENYFELNQNEASEYIINNQPDCFIEDDDKVFINFQNGNEEEKKKSHSSSLKTNATYDGDIVQNENEFFSFGVDAQSKKNVEMSKESSEILSNFIQKEKNIKTIKNNNISINLNYENNIKDIKCNLVNINEKIYTYFKKPYMRRNLKKNNKNILDIKNFIEEDEKIKEKIKFDEKGINELKDDDSKTNDSVEDEVDLFDKKKFK